MTTEASLVAFKSFKTLGILVHFDHVKDRDKEVPIGFEQIKNTAGVNLPFALVTTADGKIGVHAISAKAIHEDPRGAARDAKRKLAEVDVVGDAPAEGADDPAAEKPASDPEKAGLKYQDWTNIKGQAISAIPVEINALEVKFRLESGKVVTYPLNQLSEESQDALKTYFDNI